MPNDFNFMNTKVYAEAKEFRIEILKVLQNIKHDKVISDQLNRASLSIILNIAEGFGRFHNSDKRNFYVNARGSVFECIACLDIIFDSQIPDELMQTATELGKMLSGLIKSFSS
jgi:four helix bundle protein